MTAVASETAVMAWLALIGAGFTLALRPAGSVLVRSTLTFPVGVGAYLLIGWVTLAVGLPFSPLVALIVASALSLVTAMVTVRRSGRPRSPEWIALGSVILVVVAGSVVVQSVPLTRLSPDSVRFVFMGAILGQLGGLEEVRTFDVVNRHILEGVLFAPAALASRVYVASVLPLLGLSALASVVTLADEELRTLPVWWVARGVLGVGAVAFLLSTNRVVYNHFYVHGHMLFAVYLLLAVAGVWLAIRTGQPTWGVLAAAAMVLVVAVRVEGFLVTALVLVPALVTDGLQPRTRWLLVGTWAGAIVLWFGGVVQPAITDPGPNHAHGALLAALILLAFAAVSHRPRVRPAARFAPHLTVVGLVVAAGAFGMNDPGAMAETLSATWANIAGEGGWRLTWLGLPIIVGAALVMSRLPEGAIWWTPILGFVPLTLVLTFLRGHPFRVGPGDSGNRILMHVVLVAVTFLLISAWYPRHRERGTEPTSAASTVPAGSTDRPSGAP